MSDRAPKTWVVVLRIDLRGPVYLGARKQGAWSSVRQLKQAGRFTEVGAKRVASSYGAGARRMSEAEAFVHESAAAFLALPKERQEEQMVVEERGKTHHSTVGGSAAYAANQNRLSLRMSPYDEGERDGLKGRANRYATDAFLSETAWEAASKAERARQLRGGYTGPADNGLAQDPYGNPKMIQLQLAAPRTPEAYKRGYRVGTAQRKREEAGA